MKRLKCFFQAFLGLIAFCLSLLAQPAAWAQPTVGAVFQEVLPLGGGSTVPLPPGYWKATAVAEVPEGANKWKAYVLTNQDPQSAVAAVVVRDMDATVLWGKTDCHNYASTKNIKSFMINVHGTEFGQPVNKCSRVFSSGVFSEWWSRPEMRESSWWKGLTKGFDELKAVDQRHFLHVELKLQKNFGRGLWYEVFIQSPQGKTSGQFRDEYWSGMLSSDHQVLDRWISTLVESTQKAYLEQVPQPSLMALDFKTRGTTTASVAGSVPPNPQISAPPNPAAATQDAEAIGRRQQLEKMQFTQSVVPALLAAPAKPAPAPVADTEARELRQQLEKMQVMIAQLQAANAASAKVAQAAEIIAAAPMVRQPAAKPILANRKALIIGNDLYTDVPKLSNAAADADAMAKSLEQVGFQVFKHLNVNEKAFKQALRDFRLKVQGGDEVLFFYAGHGVQLGAANYLLPIDIKGDHEEQVKDEAVQLQKVLDDLQDKKTKFALAVVDACRDNPFKGQGRAIGGRGLAPTTAATGQMIIFSAGSGQQALDKLGPTDKDRNGLFTRIFVKEMLKPGVSVDRMLRNVRTEVVRLAQGVGHEQTPALYDQAVGEFFFLQ
jgi:hypothetical protein